MEISEDKLIVKQKAELAEAIFGLETKNKYRVLTLENQEKCLAYEKSNFFARLFLKKTRPLIIEIVNKENSKLLEIKKKFAFILPKFEVFDKNNQKLGYITPRFQWFKMKIEICDKNNKVLFVLMSKFFKPWTIKIFSAEQNFVTDKEVALISKKWSGFGKEIFTDADNFLVDFGQIKENSHKELILAASFAVDLYAFER